MSLKKGLDRLSIVVAIVAMIIFCSVIFMIGLSEGFSSYKQMILIIAGAALVSILVSLFGIRGIAYIILWIIEGFKEEDKTGK